VATARDRSAWCLLLHQARPCPRPGVLPTTSETSHAPWPYAHGIRHRGEIGRRRARNIGGRRRHGSRLTSVHGASLDIMCARQHAGGLRRSSFTLSGGALPKHHKKNKKKKQQRYTNTKNKKKQNKIKNELETKRERTPKHRQPHQKRPSYPADIRETRRHLIDLDRLRRRVAGQNVTACRCPEKNR